MALQLFFWQNEDDNLNEISLVDAFVTCFDTGYIACSICRRRNCSDCKVILLADRACERGVQGVHRNWARAQGARKSSGFRVKFWYRTIAP